MSSDSQPGIGGPGARVLGHFPVDKPIEEWIAVWAASGVPKACLLVTSLPSGRDVRLELFCPSPGAHAWLAAWLRRRLEIRRDVGLDEIDFTFFYVLLGEITGCMPDGLVDGKAVVECGIGGYHRGPADGVPCSGVSLIGDAIAALEAAARGTSYRASVSERTFRHLGAPGTTAD